MVQNEKKIPMDKLIRLERSLNEQRQSGGARFESPDGYQLPKSASCECRFCKNINSVKFVWVFDSYLVFVCNTCGGRNRFETKRISVTHKRRAAVVIVAALVLAVSLLYSTGVFAKIADAFRSISDGPSYSSEEEDPGYDEYVPDWPEEDDGEEEVPVWTTTTTTRPTTTTTTTRPTTTTTTTQYYSPYPDELARYASGLRAENRTYVISLQEDNWNINYRSSPEVIQKSDPQPYNVLGQIQSGTEIYVEYIYDNTWVVFRKDGRYVFASMYSSIDPSQRRLMYAKY